MRVVALQRFHHDLLTITTSVEPPFSHLCPSNQPITADGSAVFGKRMLAQQNGVCHSAVRSPRVSCTGDVYSLAPAPTLPQYCYCTIALRDYAIALMCKDRDWSTRLGDMTCLPILSVAKCTSVACVYCTYIGPVYTHSQSGLTHSTVVSLDATYVHVYVHA